MRIKKLKGLVISEKDFQKTVIDMAHLFGWRVAHFRAAMTKRGRWVTPVQADGAGFPDLVMVRGNRLIAAELKSTKGKVTTKQDAWLDALEAAGAESWIWRPHDFDAIENILR